MTEFGILLKELQDVESQLSRMQFGWAMRRANAMTEEERRELMAEARDIAQDELSTEEEDEPDSDEEEKRLAERGEEIRLARIQMIDTLETRLTPWAQGRDLDDVQFRRFLLILENNLWIDANGSIENYINPVTLGDRLTEVARILIARRQARQG